MAAQGAVLPPLPVYGPRVPMPQTYPFLNGGQLVTDINIAVEVSNPMSERLSVFDPPCTEVHSAGRTGAATKFFRHSTNVFLRQYLHIVVGSKSIVYERIASVFCAESNPM